MAEDRPAPRCLSSALPRPSTENSTPFRLGNPSYVLSDSDSHPASQSESCSRADGEPEPEPRTIPVSNRVPLAITTHLRNAGIRDWSHARARWQAEAPPSGRGVSSVGRANSGREIRGSRRPGGQRGIGRRCRTAVGRGLVGNGVVEPSRIGPPDLEQFRYGGHQSTNTA